VDVGWRGRGRGRPRLGSVPGVMQVVDQGVPEVQDPFGLQAGVGEIPDPSVDLREDLLVRELERHRP
jgi:hypothetical protein